MPLPVVSTPPLRYSEDALGFSAVIAVTVKRHLLRIQRPLRRIALWSTPLFLLCGLHAQTPGEAALSRAHRLHERLLRRPLSQRKAGDYTAIVEVLAPIWRHHPGSSAAETALYDAGTVEVDLAQDLHRDSAWSRAAQLYKYLLQKHPYTKYRRNAEWALGQIQWYHLDEREAARHWLRDFEEHYPADPRAELVPLQLRHRLKHAPPVLASASREAARARRRLRLRAEQDRPAASHLVRTERKPKAPAPPQVGAAPGAPSPASELVEVRGLRAWATPVSTSVVVRLSGPVTFQEGTIPEARRVYFDLKEADLGSPERTLSFTHGLIRSVRMAQNRPGVVRLVLDEAAPHESLTALYYPNPDRLVVAAVNPAAVAAEARSLRIRTPHARPEHARPERHRPLTSGPAEISHVAAVVATRTTVHGQTSETDLAPTSPLRPQVQSEAQHVSPPVLASSSRAEAIHQSSRTSNPVPLHHVAPRAELDNARLRLADNSLTRVLGLKVGRIVLDAGHGGHDTGTIGPGGIYEKDVVLDVVRRLGRKLHDQLGADVIYTRKTDVFIPLQERTAIANRAHADLFISVHANSSPERGVRGIETYYLDFTHNPHALRVAARENATGDQSEHQLRGLLTKIALQDKTKESRLLGEDVENTLARRVHEDNRGVRSAPFVVLIGAHMPSILTEITFLSNPTDARLVRSAAYRQKIADALYAGIVKYIQSLGGVQAASSERPLPMHGE